MIDLDYAFHQLERAVAVMLGRSEALDQMDISAEGFWRSFSAIAVALPALFFLWVVTARHTQAALPFHSIYALVAFDAVFEMVVWLLPIVVLAVILGPLGFRERFPHLIIVRNWSTAALAYGVAAASIPAAFLPADHPVVGLVGLMVLVVVTALSIRVTRTALQSDFVVAGALVLAELAAGFGLAIVYFSALGMGAS